MWVRIKNFNLKKENRDCKKLLKQDEDTGNEYSNKFKITIQWDKNIGNKFYYI